jgi:N-methylhydantoinase A
MQVGVDVGGTFTDFVGFRGGGVVTAKLPSSSAGSDAVLRGLRLLRGKGMAHGTTVATNAILERRGAETAFITTAGFEDLLAIGRQNRPSLYDLRITRTPPLVPRDRCFGLRERVDARGRVLLHLTEREIKRIVRAVRRSGADSVAISLLFAFLRPEHERRLAKAFHGASVSMSHRVLSEFREYERSSTTALDAYLKPLVTRYLADLERSVGPFLVMKSSGGVASHRAVQERPVDLVLSGPAGGVAAAASLASVARLPHLVTFDMGGTSADFSLLDHGQPTWTTEATIGGLPLALPVVDIESVGAGGGSLAWVDKGGALRVGPESAGAEPGPMAYGKGGTRATVTDADLVGGVLGPSLLDGGLPLDVGLARKGIEALAKELRLSQDATVLGIQQVVRASMAKAMRLVLARRGVDPREFALMAFGGAGPMHAWALARELAVRTVVVPFLPGAFSAYGILISPVRQEYSRTVVRKLDRAAHAIAECVDTFSDRAKADLTAQGFDPERAILEPSVDLRFHGQSYEINIALQRDLGAAFRREHRRRFGYASRSATIELIAVRLSARVPRPMVRLRPERRTPRGRRERRVLFEDGWSVVPVRDRSSLVSAGELDGPVVIEEAFATTLVPPGARAKIDRLGLLRIEVDA